MDQYNLSSMETSPFHMYRKFPMDLNSCEMQYENLLHPFKLPMDTNKSSSLDNPSLHCDIIQKISDGTPDTLTLHTIELLRYRREIQSDFCFHLQKYNAHVAMSSAPPIPRRLIKNPNCGPSQFQLQKSTMSEGNCTTPIVIPHSIAWKILRKSVAVILCHIGYDATPDVLLDFMTDLAQDFYVRLCGVFRQNEDNRPTSGKSDLMDVLEHTFLDVGLGSICGLHDFYQTRIIGYHQYVLKNCELLMKQHEKVKNGKETGLLQFMMTSNRSEESPADHLATSDVPSSTTSLECPSSTVEKSCLQKSPKETTRKRKKK